MKIKILKAKAKNRQEATKQLKRWFRRNPNRQVIRIDLTDGIKTVKRSEVLA